VEKARQKAQDTQERVQQVAQEVHSAVQQEAENQGLTRKLCARPSNRAHGHSGRRIDVSLEAGNTRGGCIVIPCGCLASLPLLFSGAAVVLLFVF
jgi:hypothetical protein